MRETSAVRPVAYLIRCQFASIYDLSRGRRSKTRRRRALLAIAPAPTSGTEVRDGHGLNHPSAL